MHFRAAYIRPLLLLACFLGACCARSVAASEDYDGLVPALSKSFSCLDAALLAQTLECEKEFSSSDRVSVERCSKGRGSGSGLFVLCSKRRCRNGEEAEDPVGEAIPGQDVFRIRLTGPEIHRLDILYCGRDLAYAQYALAEPGGYHAEVQTLAPTELPVQQSRLPAFTSHVSAARHASECYPLSTLLRVKTRLPASARGEQKSPWAPRPRKGGPNAQVLHLFENFTYAAHTPMFPDYLLGVASFEVARGEGARLAHHAPGAVPPCTHGRWVLGEELRCVPMRRDVLSSPCTGTGGHALCAAACCKRCAAALERRLGAG